MTTDHALLAARESFDRHAWGDAYAGLSAADGSGVLASEDLERLAIAAQLLGRPDESAAAGARAHLEAIRAGDVERAVRCAIRLGMALMQRGEMAQAGGWLARAGSLIEETGYDGVERGTLLIPQALQALMAGEPATALGIFEQVAAIAERFGDRDLMTIGRLGRGQSLIAMSDTARGVPLLDEAMAAVIAGEISPIVAGIVYCAVIEACQALFDLRRAQEWTTALNRWCESQPDLVPFRGNCLIYRAELLRFHGAWQDAADEAQRARDWLSTPPPDPAVGEALYQLAELDRLRGRFDSAEAAYREASSWGRLPEPGLALLRLAQSDIDAAAASIRRAFAEATDDLVRARLLEPQVEIALAAGDLVAARDAADRIAGLAEAFGAPLLRAMAARSDGAVRLAAGDVDGALGVLRRAWDTWRELDAPYEAARVRILVGRACLELGDLDGAALEFEAARDVFERLGAIPDLARLERESGERIPERAGGLSPREVEILRLVAAGNTNRAIAEGLSISERTVDRHVSNIFTKLDVSTRAAATAFAYEHDLV
jgi:DNA-binding CsgD family transcriptional regulator/HPt (histidine-containing phosphotransfer) domain-containing protein